MVNPFVKWKEDRKKFKQDIACYQQTKQEAKDISEKLKISNQTLRMIAMRLITLNGVQAGYKTKKEFIDHFDELITDDKLQPFIYKDGVKKYNWETEHFIDEMFHYIVKVPKFMDHGYIQTVKYIYGDDGFLKYFYECDECKSIHVVDHSNEGCTTPIVCKHCHPDYKSVHDFIEVGTEEWKGQQDWVTHNKRLNTDKFYAEDYERRMKRDHEIYELTKYFRPSYWKALSNYNKRHAVKKLKPNEKAKSILLD